LNNYFVYGDSNIFDEYFLTLGGYLALGAFMAGLSGGGSYAFETFEMGAGIKAAFSTPEYGISTVITVAITGSAVGVQGFVSVNNVVGDWYSKS